MAILTRETNGTGVTNNNAPLTNPQLDNNFIELVADIAGKQPLDDDLTAIAGLTGTEGFLKKTAANTWELDTAPSLAYLPLTGGTMTGNITFSDDQEGIVWSRNTDSAYIKFFNTADGDTDSRLEYATSDNGTEYHRWVHFTPSSTEYELMALRYNAGVGDLTVTGTVTADRLTVNNSTTTPVVINRDQAIDGYGLILNQPNTTNGNGLEISYQTTTTGTVTPNTPFAGIDFTADTHDWSTRLGSIQLKTAQGGVGYKTRLNVAGNGDISFYEDTGTTAKFYWDASAESLGIGTTTVSNPFTVAQAVQIGALSGNGGLLTLGGSSGSVYFGDSGSGYAGYINYQHSDDSLRFGTGTSERMRINSSGNVGIGTTSPVNTGANYGDLTINGTDGSFVNLQSGGSTTGILQTINTETRLSTAVSGGFLAFRTDTGGAGTERCRIDSSGNLLVGTTDTDPASNNVNGFAVSSTGVISASKGNEAVANFSRRTSDGDIVVLKKGGATVGSIGTDSGDIYFGSGSSGTERMRIDSSGNVGIGTTLPQEPLHVAGNIRLGDTAPAEIYTNSSELRIGVDRNDDNGTSDITFYSNNSEKVRIDADGNVTLFSGSIILPDFGIVSSTATTTSTTQTAILSFSATTYAGAKIVVTATTGVNRHICELLVAHDGTTAIATQYGSVTTASDLTTYDVDISGGNVRLLATSASATSTVYKVSGTLMEA